eukprot:CAMPEP_0198291834 /NCGR_PEP_ID=MMETSP1449-20131203/9216_1 /TAXON_ID=420275 /ORGANISM="Attheya septentrionalis, Strain CCMP2084" /LENGTH=186 /DNA_ID=CAMNT_0043990517 /DNA_START=544 /DNA_END=1104 /DNA_ORIENTATION=+
MCSVIRLAVLAFVLLTVNAFSPVTTGGRPAFAPSIAHTNSMVGQVLQVSQRTTGAVVLRMSDGDDGGREKSKSKKVSRTILLEDVKQEEEEEEKNKEEQWRVVLHNDEVHTFNYVIRALTKSIGTLDRKRAFDICVATHGVGKATISTVHKKQAEQYCLGLQRVGLTVSISPDKNFEGGHSGGGFS